VISYIRDVSAAKADEEKIRNLAFYDTLTGLPNRRLLWERLRQALISSIRSGSKHALLFVDLDGFKSLNDTLGHHIGDLLLQETARRIAGCVREVDTVARLGGDEFVIILEDLSQIAEIAAAQARTVGGKILAAIDQPILLEGRECHTTSSMGITVFGNQNESTNEVLQQADIAMYQAKAAGRNAMFFFAPALQASVNARVALERDLRAAIRDNQFSLFYQPQLDRGLLTGAEALIRWNHPTRGLVTPQDFVPLAEETGLIFPMGSWVLETACLQIAAWAGRKEGAHLSIAVNVSAREFRQPKFVDHVLSALERTGANPNNLKIELSESMFGENVEDVITRMTKLKAHGVRFSLEDFGTGYSSMSYLKRLPLDQIKIDRAFVNDILKDPISGAVAQAIISFGKAMGLSVIAEGVETEEQRAFLARMGCHSFQGYLFSHPLPLGEFYES
jgi:diguanylate cyclase (GGDEF)-like protein